MRVIAEQIAQLIGKALDLQDLTVLDRPGCPDNGVAGTDQHIRIGIDGTRAIPQSPDEAIMQTAKALLARVGQIQIGEQSPDTDR